MGWKGEILFIPEILREYIKGYRLYDEETRKVFRSKDVIFYEKIKASATNEKVSNKRLLHTVLSTSNSEDDPNGAGLGGDNSSDRDGIFDTPDENETELSADNPEQVESCDDGWMMGSSSWIMIRIISCNREKVKGDQRPAATVGFQNEKVG